MATRSGSTGLNATDIEKIIKLTWLFDIWFISYRSKKHLPLRQVLKTVQIKNKLNL